VVVRGDLTFDANPERLRPEDSAFSLAKMDLETQLGFDPLGVEVLVSDDYPVDALSKAAEELTRSGVVSTTTGAHRLWPSDARRERVAELMSRSRGWIDATLKELREAGFRPAPFRAGLEKFDGLLCAEPLLPEPTEGKFEWRGENYWKSTFHPPHSLKTPAEREEFKSALRAALGVPAKMLGPGALADELGPLMAKELRNTILVLALVIVVLVVLSVGSLGHGVVALLPVVSGLGISLGFLTISGWSLHPGNFLALPLILGLGVDDGLHMVHRAREAKADPIRTTGIQVWRTTGTTALGFGSLVTASSPVIASMGSIVLVGTLVCFLTSVIFVPQLMRKFSRE